MGYQYWADGDNSIYRVDANDQSLNRTAEVFSRKLLDWKPRSGIGPQAQNGDIQQVSEREANRVCDLIRASVKAADHRVCMTALESAKTIAHREHSNQSDKAGQPYIGHVSRVAARVSDDHDAETVAWLHDVVEDTSIELSDLGDEFAPHIVAAVDAITRRVGEAPADYYRRVRGNDLARRVKLADIADNSDPVRLAGLDSATRERLERKYRQALEAVSA